LTAEARPTSFGVWQWPVQLDAYDRSPALGVAERSALSCIPPRQRGAVSSVRSLLNSLHGAERLVRPLVDAASVLHADRSSVDQAVLDLVRGCAEEDAAFWGWPPAVWRSRLAPPPARGTLEPGWNGASRHSRIGIAYLLGCLPDLSVIHVIHWRLLAPTIFGPDVEVNLARLRPVLQSWAYSPSRVQVVEIFTCRLMLEVASPCLEVIDREVLERTLTDPAFAPRSAGGGVAVARPG